VIDATEDITFTITSTDIKKASLKSPSSCVMAQACKRETKHEARVHISRIYIKENGGDTWLRYYVPQSVRTEIIAFDKGGAFAPGTYTITAPTKSQKIGYQLNRKRSTGPRKRKIKKYTYVKDIRTGPANGI